MSDDAPPIDAVYDRLRRIASSYLDRERLDHTLDPTALVHEAWLRLARYRARHELSDEDVQVLASRVMRHVLTDSARRRLRLRRDARRTVSLGSVGDVQARDAEHVVAVDAALGELAAAEPDLAQVVEMRFFGGLTLGEIARALGCSTRTVDRRWRLARAWLVDALDGDAP